MGELVQPCVTYSRCSFTVTSAMDLAVTSAMSLAEIENFMLADVPQHARRHIKVGRYDPAALLDALNTCYLTPQGIALAARQCQNRSETVAPLIASMREGLADEALADKALECNNVFFRLYDGEDTGLVMHFDRTFFKYRVTFKACLETQIVLFEHADTGERFRIIHLPGTWYSVDKVLMTDRWGMRYKHGVEKSDRKDAILSVVADFGSDPSIFSNGSLWLNDFSAPERLPPPSSLTMRPINWMGMEKAARIMPRWDPSRLGKHRDSEKERISKFS